MIALTGGGTGGHLSSLRVLKKAILELGTAPTFIGSTYGQDRRWFACEEGFAACYFLNTRGVVNRNPLGKAVSLSKIALAAAAAMRILRRHHVKAVLSVGGYAAAPASFAAVSLRIPLFIHEHNAVIGGLHRVLLPLAQTLFSSYDNGSPVRDYPVDAAFFNKRRVRRSVLRVLFMGGSQGARYINNFALSAAPFLDERGIDVSHQTGERDYRYVKARYRSLNVNADIFPFDSAMADRMSQADLAVSRAGAGTVWELAANGLPALFVPYPYAVRDHQYLNANYFAKQRLGWVTRESSLKLEMLFSALRSDIGEVSSRLIAMIRPGGAQEMAEYVMGHIKH